MAPRLKPETRAARVHAMAADGMSQRRIAKALSVGKGTVARDLEKPAPTLTIVANLQDEHGRPVAGAEQGNARALTHGADSPQRVMPEAHGLVPGILAANPHLAEDRDGAAVLRYAMNLARIDRVYRWLDARHDAVFADLEAGELHGVFDRLSKWEASASRSEEQLAIAPLTRVRLGLDKLRGAGLHASLADLTAAAERGRQRTAALADIDGEAS